jgi:hypothetical protein
VDVVGIRSRSIPLLLLLSFALSACSVGPTETLYPTSGISPNPSSIATDIPSPTDPMPPLDTSFSAANMNQGVVDLTRGNRTFTAETGSVAEISFDAQPMKDRIDGVIGYSDASMPIRIYADTCIAVRMNSEGTWDVRSGKDYVSDAYVKYSANELFHVRIVIDLSNERYDVWITPSEGEEVQVGKSCAFRQEAMPLGRLGRLVLASGGEGDFRITDHQVDGVSTLLCPANPAPTGTRGPATILVGPERDFKTLQSVSRSLVPGDTVLVDGGTIYPGDVTFYASGTQEAPILVRGVRVDGRRPVISGGDRGVAFSLSNHYVFEGFEIEGAGTCGIYCRADDIMIRDCFIRDCPNHGILCAMNDSGDLTLSGVEVARCGSGTQFHPVYADTDEVKYPGSVFRMQGCFLHDQNGGNNVKSRARRNEIWYNRIEGGYFRELELIGPDGDDRASAPLRPFHSDVVGNLFIKRSMESPSMVRIGHDRPGNGSEGRYRFLNNDFVVLVPGLKDQTAYAIQAYGVLESVELCNNVFFGSGVPLGVLRDTEAEWLEGAVVGGWNNWVQVDATWIPKGMNETILGVDPGFVDALGSDFRLAYGSGLIDRGTQSPEGVEGYGFPAPKERLPSFTPPAGPAAGPLLVRRSDGAIDIGAFER